MARLGAVIPARQTTWRIPAVTDALIGHRCRSDVVRNQSVTSDGGKGARCYTRLLGGTAAVYFNNNNILINFNASDVSKVLVFSVFGFVNTIFFNGVR